MLSFTKRISLAAFLCTLTVQVGAQSSVLSSGAWYKISVAKNGIYKISFDQFKKMGFDPSQVNPKNIRVYGNPGGMLPQANAASRPFDLVENPIWVEGESDGKFDGSDFILFYGEGADKISYSVSRDSYQCEKNLYSTVNYYFVTVASEPGKRIPSRDDLSGNHPVITETDDFIYHEEEKVKLDDIISGREWYGETFGSTASHEFTVQFSGITGTKPLRFVSHVLGQSFDNTSFRISLNTFLVDTQKLAPIPALRYGPKAVLKRDTFLIHKDTFGLTAETKVKYEFKKAPGSSKGFLDLFLITFPRRLSLYNNQWTFVTSYADEPFSRFELINVPNNAIVWDVTDTQQITNQRYSRSGSTISFGAETSSLKKFIVANTTFEQPVLIGKVINQNLHGLGTPTFLIITHKDLVSQAERLANHRSTFAGITATVVTTDVIYNEFSSGRQDVTAIRDFIKHLTDKNPGVLKTLLLFGKSSYDYKDRLSNNTNLVPTYQSRNSIHPLLTYSSDDFFTFLQNHEGQWSEDPAQTHSLDIGVGRLPVSTIAEATTVVDKIIRYDTDERAKGIWRKRMVFVGDDGNGDDTFTTLHQEQANEISATVEQLNPAIDTRKLFMGSYQKMLRPNGETVDKLTQDIIRSIDLGALIVNYTGHGSDDQWADENVFNTEHIKELHNENYPFMVTATCEFGRHDNPEAKSGAEALVLQPEGGAIGLVTTARPVNATTNRILNEAFYEALLNRDGIHYKNLGEVFRLTKNTSTSGISNRNFSLLADPSQVLALPPLSVQVTKIETATGSDTLKALSRVIVEGQINDGNNALMTSFNGVAEMTVFDKQATYVTGGRNLPYEYTQWTNALFRGAVTVRNGSFESSFMLPKNIAYQIAEGKISVYARDTASNEEAIGSYNEFKVGGTEANAPTDGEAPVLKAYIGDTTFVNGGLASEDSWLWVTLHDNTGINISNYGIGNSITATLDDDQETFILNDYYVSHIDRSSGGYIRYPLRGLSPGRHSIRVKAWDLNNNSGETQVDFIVTDGDHLRIESFASYPNPFKDRTIIFFTHNRAGDDLQAQISLLKTTGEVLFTKDMEVLSSSYQVDLGEIDVTQGDGKKLLPGLYLARVVIRSLTNGSKNERVAKLILLN